MGSILHGRYWTCPQCLNQFDWEDGSAKNHHPEQCRRDSADARQWRADVEKGRALADKMARDALARELEGYGWAITPLADAARSERHE